MDEILDFAKFNLYGSISAKIIMKQRWVRDKPKNWLLDTSRKTIAQSRRYKCFKQLNERIGLLLKKKLKNN